MSNLDRPVFVRVGWLRYYDTERDDGALPERGGSYNTADIGSEIENFRPRGGKLYGYGQAPRASGFNPDRIGIEPHGRDAMAGILVVFVSTHETGGQRVIGWYRNATLLRESKAHPSNSRAIYNITAPRDGAVLLPESERTQKLSTGKGKPGKSNVFYPLDQRGRPRRAAWIREIVSYIQRYRGRNLLKTDDDPADERYVPRARGQGFGASKRERDLVEKHAMQRAKSHFEHPKYGFDVVKDVHAVSPCDLVCIRDGKIILRVEVKGTTGPGYTVIVTKGEVDLARREKTALFVVSSIELRGSKARGGKDHCVNPWKPADAKLTPLQYRHVVPRKPRPRR